jgi:hypothetical protein
MQVACRGSGAEGPGLPSLVALASQLLVSSRVVESGRFET